MSDHEEVDDLFGSDEQHVSEESSVEEHEDKVLEILLPRHAILGKPEDDTYVVKVPVFLNVEAHPFDPSEFKDQVKQNAEDRNKSTMDAKQIRNDLVAEKLINENSIRWRYSNSGNDEIIKQSNAHFVQWDDGLVSLKVGAELFDFKSLPLTDHFLVRSHDQYEILQNDSVLNKSANLVPSSTFTSTHRNLTEALKNNQKKAQILNTLTENDPLLKQKLADENERKSAKLKRQLEQKRRLQEDRLERTSTASSRTYEPAYERFEREYGDEYDEEDDFVANDDEEVEEFDDEEEEEEFEKGAERLKQLKSEGDAKYRSATPDEETQRKRRRIIESDDEE